MIIWQGLKNNHIHSGGKYKLARTPILLQFESNSKEVNLLLKRTLHDTTTNSNNNHKSKCCTL